MVDKTGVIKAVRPISTPTYRLQAKLGRGEESTQVLLSSAVDLVYDWFDRKLDEKLPIGEARFQSFRSKSTDPDLEVIFIPEKGIWSSRLSHLDTGLIQGKPILGRRWVTDVSLTIKDNAVFMGIQITALSQPGLSASIEYIRPGIVRSLANRIGLQHEWELRESFWEISGIEGIERLKKLIFSKDRQLPVVLITQPDWRKWEFSQKAPEYLVSPEALGKKLIGYAHVIALPFSEAFKWTETLGKAWSVFDGAIRIYRKGINLDEDDLSVHPLFFKDKIFFARHGDKFGGEAFSDLISADIRQRNPSLFQTWDFVQFIADARLIKAKSDREKLIDKEECVGCKDAYEEEIYAYQQKLEESLEESQQWSDASLEADSISKRLERENSALRRQLDSLRMHLEAKSGGNADEELVIPDSYDDLPDWVVDNLSGRLVLHPRAIRAVKDAIFEDVNFVYECLLLLANDYRSMRLGKITQQKFDEKCNEKNLRMSSSIAKERAGEQGETYYVQYPIGTQNKEFLELHLRRGTVKDDRYTLGIYFFWDNDTDQVVVGWLPSHLKNRMT